jgi:hypothetical protein
MGWNSWNAFGLGVDDARIRAAGDALLSSGLAAHGWNYLNIDDGWESTARSSDGSIRGNEKFPDMVALGSYLHSRGLKFGIYSSPGPLTCGRFLGSLAHERQDADSYASWGVDYLKYDLCSYEDLMSPEKTLEEHQLPYRIMGEALHAQPRDIVFSLCQYGNRDVWKTSKIPGPVCSRSLQDKTRQHPMQAVDIGTTRTCWWSAVSAGAERRVRRG